MVERSEAAWPSVTRIERLRIIVTHEMGAPSHGSFRIVASPYRICPLGAHVDHQGGAVTAMALDRGVLLGFAPSGGAEIRVRSGQFAGKVSFQIPRIDHQQSRAKLRQALETRDSECRWDAYLRGACYALISRGYKISEGMVGFVDGCPGMHGCGVSSSAAVGVAFLLALEELNKLKVSPEENVELDRVIENEFLGLQNGVLDPSAILLSRRGCLTLIRCSERSHEVVPLGSHNRIDYRIILAFSGLTHALTSKSGFNLRVTECQNAAKVLLKAVGRDWMAPVLGNVTTEEFAIHKNKLDGELVKRAQHFFTEKNRVEAGVRAWAAGDLETLGKLMTESGRSSIVNYECGCEPLIQLWEILLKAPGVLGARFSGAGFRGCCVALVKADLANEAAEFVSNGYREAQPELWKNVGEAVMICDSGDSARLCSC